MSDLPRFEKKEVIEIRGDKYRIKSIDTQFDSDKVHQYRMEGITGPPANLEANHDEGTFVLKKFEETHPDQIEKSEDVIGKVISENPDALEDYPEDREGVINFLVGQVMQETGGSYDPGDASRELRQRLEDE